MFRKERKAQDFEARGYLQINQGLSEGFDVLSITEIFALVLFWAASTFKSRRLVQKLPENSITKSQTSLQVCSTSGIALDASEPQLWKKSLHMYSEGKKKIHCL